MGRGYSDEFPGFSGNLPALFTTAKTNSYPNLDTGQGGFDSAGTFELVDLETWNLQAQYFWSDTTFSTLGMAYLYSDNIGDLTPDANKVLYDWLADFYFNILHDFSPHLRAGLEFGRFQTHYLEETWAFDNRGILALYFRF